VNWKRTVITAEKPLDDAPHAFEAFWKSDGTMQLQIDRRNVARGKAPGLLNAEPGDSLQIGADRVKPVGDYTEQNAFRGSISGLYLKHPR